MRRAIPAVLVLLLASCGGERAEAPAAPSTPPPAQPVATTTTSSTDALTIAEDNGTMTIAFADNGAQHKLVGEERDSGKRKYTLDGGAVLYEIKPGEEDGFKLRNPDGSLRWKVKVTPEKVKISDNEQNDHPFELKVKDANRVKVVAPEDRELGNVRYEGGRIVVENASGAKIFTKESSKFSGAYGVLLLDTIPAQERYILIAELLDRNR